MQSSSSTCLLASSSSKQTSSKNWEASFGQLASSYGFSGGVPSFPKKTKSTKSDIKSSGASINSQTSSQSTFVESRPIKNYEAAFGHLSSAYGFGGGVPSLPSKSSKSSKSSSSSTTPSVISGSSKDYQSAYGSLSSAYGFGVPVSSKS